MRDTDRRAGAEKECLLILKSGSIRLASMNDRRAGESGDVAACCLTQTNSGRGRPCPAVGALVLQLTARPDLVLAVEGK